ncbi:uncharacterized protein B0I36DRAFT_328183 [Microdochium trichocladiopsis]|uniref:Alpha/Beta hydrolase protein n=1 Tax=Microdochium trichocladiopsis TaxID=1682393 RepID=A0A9P8Y2Z3_9PEZI|nr:uncharacterized protein B0I36DRAFT_328183 [Microdochium trichocladiopsis]KAH7027904.1 hypothetical protein B0I36DRAFT_328183 [Microdochium trichocladiopsis]
MTRWTTHSPRFLARLVVRPSRRPYSSAVQRIPVPCGMSGNVIVDLYNLDTATDTAPLLIYLPPFYATPASEPVQLPPFCRELPTAVINYRWAGFSPWEDDVVTPLPSSPSSVAADEVADTLPSEHLQWPAPIHDTTRAYSWLLEQLEPPAYTRRSVYVYGSYLGASLATSLALTENHPHLRMAVRGCVAFNGIYNWTMFLPNHPIHHQARARGGISGSVLDQFITPPEDAELQELGEHAESLFRTPENMFDHFASPCLFFHTPGLLVPPSFDDEDNASISRAVYAATMPSPSPSVAPDEPFPDTPLPLSSSPASASSSTEEHEEMIAQMAALKPLRPPRRHPLIFPPRTSTLKIPEALLLHTSPPPTPFQTRAGGRRKGAKKPAVTATNSFAHQASELAAVMHKSINRLEIRERRQWEDDSGEFDEEAARRVQVADVGLSQEFFELPQQGQEMVKTWLEDRMEQHA